MPFLGVSNETIGDEKFWVLKNGGAGVAINIQAQWLSDSFNSPEIGSYPSLDGRATLLLLDPIPVGDRYVLCPSGSLDDVVKKLLDTGTFFIQYESLQGKRYRTIVYDDGQLFARNPGVLNGERDASQLKRRF